MMAMKALTEKLKEAVLASPVNLPLLLFSFSLPFGGNFNSYFFILYIACFVWGLIRGNYSIKGFPPLIILFPVALYILWVISGFYSAHKDVVVMELILKSSVLVFPLTLFYCYNNIAYRGILASFVVGCIVATILCFGRATGLFINSHDYTVFTYGTLSWFMHAGYFAMYLIFSSLIIFLWNRVLAKDATQKIPVALQGGLLLVHYISIVLLSSRTNIIGLFILFILLFLGYFLKRKYRKESIIIGSGILVVLISMFFIFRSGQNYRLERLKNIFTEKEINKASDESVDVRLLIWRASVTAIKENFWTGTGIGDAKIRLMEEYKAEGLTGAEEKALNAHNEFLQTFVGVGVLGFLLLLMAIFSPLPLAISRGDILLVCLVVLIFINFFTESMLERQAGVVFFSFFYSLLFIKQLKSKT